MAVVETRLGRSSTRRAADPHHVTRWLVACLVLSGFNLRPALASTGALLHDIRSALHMNGVMAGVLTALPSAGFALAAFATPLAVRRLRPEATVAWAMVLISVGLGTRVVATDSLMLLACTGAAVAGIGVANVAMSAVVRERFAHRVPFYTGVYTGALTAGAALSAAVSVPVAQLAGGWRAGVGVWSLPAVAAALAWLVVLGRRNGRGRRSPLDTGAAHPVAATGSTSAHAAAFARSGAAWCLAVFFGLQAAGAYIVLGWLPQILVDSGVSPAGAGAALALTPVVSIPFAFLIPVLIGRGMRAGRLVVVLGVLGAFGYVGLIVAPTSAPWLWAVLFGVSQASFPLALTLIGLRGSAGEVTALSAFTQGVGYLIAAPCSLAVGVLVQASDGWSVPIVFMAALLVPQMICGVIASTRRGPGDGERQRPGARVTAP